MSQSELNISLRTELRDLVEQAVASGNYSSPSEVISEALGEWLLQHLPEKEIQRLRRAWDEGLTSGDTKPFDLDAVFGEARLRMSGHH